MPYVEILLALALAGCYGRVFRPAAGPAPGEVVRREMAPLLARLRLHGGPAGAVLVLAGAAVGLGSASATTGLVVIGAVALLLCLPGRYTFTTEGIQLGRTRVRRWTEFGGVARRPGGARLQGISGARGLTVWLAGARDADETILLLRQMVRGSYKGDIGPAPRAAADERQMAALDVARAAG